MKTERIQPMDLTSLCAVLEEFHKSLVPSRFEKAQQPNKNTIQFAFRTIDKLKWIEISWDAEASRIVEIVPPLRFGEESTLAKQFQHVLNKMALVEIEQEEFERIVELKLALRPGEKILRIILIEIMGRHSNIFLLDEQRRVITLGRQVRESKSRLRPISTGDIYTPPPSLKGIKPSIKENFTIWKERLCLVPENFDKALQKSYQGISPSLARQISDKVFDERELLSSSHVLKISEKGWEKLYENWVIWLKAMKSKDFTLCFDGPTSYKVWSKSQDTKKDDDNLALLLGIYYRNNLDHKSINTLTSNIQRQLLVLKIHEEKELLQQKELLEKTSDIISIQDQANKLLSKTSPNKTQINEAQKLYLKAKKLRRSIPLIKERIKYYEFRIRDIELTNLFLDEILNNEWEDDSQKLKMIYSLKQEINDFLTIEDKIKKKRIKTVKENIQPLELISPNGLKLQIGRNHRQNELISFKKSRDGDLWFHAQECPGSHVILKTSNEHAEEVDIMMAANLAALFSRAKGNSKVPINVVPTSKLKRVKGALPGTLIHKDGEVIWGEPLIGKKYLEEEKIK